MRMMTAETLEAKNLEDLLDRRIVALRIPNWLNQPNARKLSELMLNCKSRTRHLGMENDGKGYNTDHDRVGPSFVNLYRKWEANSVSREEVLGSYLALCVETRAYFDQNFRAQLPIDKLFERGKDLWTWGAEPARFQGLSVFYGSGRIWGGLPSLPYPHVDHIHPALYRFEGQLSAVAYLSVPKVGGELRLWDVEEEKYTQAIMGKSIPLEEMPDCMKIRPLPGELILFNARKPHMVMQVDTELRVVQQCFIGLSRGKPLTFWT